MTMRPKFSVGQRVRIVRETVFHFGYYVGQVGTIEDAYPRDECSVLFDGHTSGYGIVFRNDEIEVIDENGDATEV